MKNKIKTGYPRKCDYCQENYIPTHYNQRFCKREHYENCVICREKYHQINLVHPKNTCGKKECRNKLRELTNLELFGVKNPFQSEEKKEKIKKTNLKKYGKEHTLQVESIREKGKQTSLEKYGVEYPNQSSVVKAKIKETNLKKYGTPWVLSSEYFKNKSKETSITKYGVEYPSQAKVVKEKIEKTNLERYGATSIFGNKEIRNKIKKGFIDKYGVEHPSKSTIIKEKTKKTNLERYGVEYGLQAKEVRDKIKQTNLNKYGVENPFQSKDVQERINQKNLERYGTIHPSQTEQVKQKIKETCIKKYGVPNPFQNKDFYDNFIKEYKEKTGYDCPAYNPAVIEKRKRTCLEKYGTEWVLQSPEIQDNIKQTILLKYGVDSVFKSPKIREQIKQTNLLRYGGHPMTSPEVVDKLKQTNLERYGVEHYFQTEEFSESQKQFNLEKYGVKSLHQKHVLNIEDWENFEDFILKNSQKYTVSDLMKYFNLSLSSIRQKTYKLNLIEHIKDFYNSSINELNFIDLLKIHNFNVGKDYRQHSRDIISPYEIDFYFPEIKIGVEISPTWTHKLSESPSFGKPDKEYHYNKFKMCKEKGVELITVFDWIDVEKVINFIKSKTKKVETVYGRKTKVNVVKGLTKEHKMFLEENHILGKINNSKTTEVVELLYNDVLVGIGVFEKKTKYTELRRLAFNSNYRVQGGASKIINAYLKLHPELDELITFSDNDLGTGNVYKTLGFEIIEENKGMLIWYNEKHNKKISNMSLVLQGTDRLLKNFPGYEYVGQGAHLPSNQEIIASYGFLPIYDCGYTKWILKIAK